MLAFELTMPRDDMSPLVRKLNEYISLYDMSWSLQQLIPPHTVAPLNDTKPTHHFFPSSFFLSGGRLNFLLRPPRNCFHNP